MNLEKLNPEAEEVITREELLSIQGGGNGSASAVANPTTVRTHDAGQGTDLDTDK